jgi:CBS domain-containing protein
MVYLKQILQEKGGDVWSIKPDDMVFAAIQLMADKRIGALLVIDGETLAGIISERDYAREVILKGRSSRETAIREIMTDEVITVSSDHRVQDSLGLMNEHRIRHLPVVDEGKVVGMISIGDLVKNIIDEQQSTIEHLENYIKG